MIAGVFHQGSGLGNQLFRYVATRVLAEDKGYEFGMMSPNNFKGSSFLYLDMGVLQDEVLSTGNVVLKKWNEKKVVENGIDIRSYDPEFNFIKDHTILDGEFQDERYFEHRMPFVSKILAVEPLSVPDDVCLIGFRGGEYALFSDLFLPKSLYFRGVELMKRKGITKFEVHTDDPVLARQFFPDFPIVDNQQLSHSNHTNMGLNWRAMRYAKHAIIANSSFYILPRLLKQWEDKEAVTLAPRYWARHNTKTWALPQNYYKSFTYMHGEDKD